MNVVCLVGNCATAPQTRVTGSGKMVTTFRLAVPRMNSEKADFFDVVTFDKVATYAGDYLKCGDMVMLEGRLHHNTWQSADGPRSRVEIIAQRLNRRSNAKNSGREGHAVTGFDPSGPGEGRAVTGFDPQGVGDGRAVVDSLPTAQASTWPDTNDVY